MSKIYEIDKIVCADVPNKAGRANFTMLYLEKEGTYKTLVTPYTEESFGRATYSENRGIIEKQGLKDYLEERNLDCLLYDYKYCLKEKISKYDATEMFDVIRFERYLTEEQKNQIREICLKVVAYLIIKLNVPKKAQSKFKKVMEKYLYLDAINSSRSSINWYVTKEKDLVDYKLLRTFKACNLDINKLKQTEDFKVRVSDDSIFISENKQQEQIIYTAQTLGVQKTLKNK